MLIEVDGPHGMTAGRGRQARLAVPTPDDIVLVTAGGEGAGWSAYAPSWAPRIHARASTRRVRPSGEPLPDCGPDGCIVPWLKESA